MKINSKKSLLTVLVVACLSFVCAFMALGAGNVKSSAYAEDTYVRPENSITAESSADDFFTDTSFYVYDGAAVRVKNSGLKFVTYVDPAFHAELTKDGATVTYFATAKKVGGTNELAKEIPFHAEIVENGMYELRTYINFGNVEKDSPDQAATYYANDYTTSTFAKVVSESATTYYQASDGVVRSMRAVGNASVLGFTDTDKDGNDDKFGYTLSDVEKYITVGERTETTKAYVFADDGSDYVSFAGLDGTKNTSIDVYVGAKNVGKFTYSADNNVYVGALTDAENADYISTFVDGKVYSVKAGDAIRISSVSDMTDKFQVASSGNFVLEKDIDMTDVAWSPTGGEFTGIFDGNGHKITNFKAPTGYAGLFPNVNGATLRNVNIHITSNTNRAAITGQVKGPFLVEDCVIDADNLVNGPSSGVITNVVQGAVTVDNVIINVKKSGTDGGIISGQEACSHNITVSDCYLVSPRITNLYDGKDVSGKKTGNPLGVGGELAEEGKDYEYYSTIEGLGDAIVAGEIPAVLAKGAEDLGLITYVNADNIDVLKTASTGYYYLTDNVDMTTACKEGAWAPAQSYDTEFSGVLNGNGKTLSNFTPGSANYEGLFAHCGGTITAGVVKNVTIEMTNTPNRAGLFGRVNNMGVKIQDSTVYLASATTTSGSALVGVANGPVEIVDTTVVYKSHYNAHAYLSHVDGDTSAGKYTLDNFNIIDFGGTERALHGCDACSGVFGADGKTEAKAGEDFTIYTDKDLIVELINKGEISSKAKTVLHKNKDLNPIAKANITDLYTAKSEYYYLTENINMSDVTWAPGYTDKTTTTPPFTGVLNGNNFTIDNFKTVAGQWGSLLPRIAGGTVKNLAFTNAEVAHSTSGIISRDLQANSLIENVYVHLKSTTSGGLFAAVESSGSGLTTAKIKDTVVVIDATGGSSFINAAHCVSIALENCYFLGGATRPIVYNTNATYAGALAADGVTAAEDQKDYFKYTDKSDFARDAINGKAKVSEFIKNSFIANQNVTLINKDNDNILKLQSAKSGIFILTSDIDMDGVAWAPTTNGSTGGVKDTTNVFKGVLDGNGFTIKNFSAPAGNFGLLGYTGAGATVKNLTLHAKTNGGSRAVLTGQVWGATSVSNCKFYVESLSGAYSSVISNVVQGTLTVTDTYIAIGNAVAGVSRPGIVAGGEASSYSVVLSKVYAYSVVNYTTDMFKGDNYDTNVVENTYGTDEELAVNGEDYFLYESKDVLDTALDAGTVNADFKAWLTSIGLVSEN